MAKNTKSPRKSASCEACGEPLYKAYTCPDCGAQLCAACNAYGSKCPLCDAEDVAKIMEEMTEDGGVCFGPI